MFTSTPAPGKIATPLTHCGWILGILLYFSSFVAAQKLPAGFLSSTVQSGYDTPVGTVFSPDGQQLFVWDKAGRVFVSTWNGTTYTRQSTPVLDISDEVGNWRDFGLLSVCLDPNFSQNGLFYLFYVVDRHHLLYYGTSQYNKDANEYFNATISRVTRYRAGNTNGSLIADRNSRQVLLGESKSTGIPVLYESHAGGTLLFGRDGTLLVSTGDNASYDAIDVGNERNTYVQTALNEGMMRPAENVGSLRSQMITSLCGKVLRLDPNTGNGVASNPFFNGSNPRAPQSRVWALGLRNPFRMSFQPNTGSTNPNDGNPGTLFVGDVGWYTYEDLQRIDKGGLNCGWPLYEGLDTAPGYYGRNIRNTDEPGQPTFESQCQPPTSATVDADPARRRLIHSRPILDWRHESPIARVPDFDRGNPIVRNLGTDGAPAGTPFQGNAAMGGVFYTGTQFPAAYQNTYFFADFGQNWIKNIVLHDHDDQDVEAVRDFAGNGFGQGVVHLDVSPLDGSLYCVNLNGQIIRISYGGNQPPTARPTAPVTSGSSPLSVQFSGSTSSDPEGRSLTYRWDFGDGTTSTEANPQHVFSSGENRSFTVTLVVTDVGQLTDTQSLVISLNSVAPTVRITNPANGSLYPLNKISYYQLQADVTDSNPATLAYEWQVWLQHNNHEHPEPIIREASPQVQISPVGCSGTDTYSYRITLKVTNQGGLTASTSVQLFPDCASGTTTVGQVTATPGVNAVQLSWKNPAVAFDDIMVVARPGSGFQSHPSGTEYTADANFTGNGTAFESGKVVYRGTEQGVTVQSLNASTPYYFRIYTRIGTTWNEGVEVAATPTGNTSSGTALALAMTAPLYNCATGAITFRTTGGNGSAVEYAAGGITGWTTNPNQTVESGLRGDPKVIILNARQGNVQVSYTFDLPNACGSGATSGNRAPVVSTPLGTQLLTQQQAFTFTIPGNTFADPDNQSLTYSMTGLPDGLTFDANTATLSGQPTSVGQSTVTLTATDPGNLSVSLTFVIRVEAATSTPGTTTSPSTTTPTTGFAITGVTTVSCETVSPTLRQISFTPQYAGLNGQAVTFSVIGEMMPTTSAGPYTVRVYTDNPTITLKAQQTGTNASFAYSWLAACANNTGTTPPTTANRAPRVANSIADQRTTANQPFTLSVPGNTFADPENQSLTFSLTGLPDGLRFDPGTAIISGQPTSVGQSTVTLTATDPGNLSVSLTFVIRVEAATSTPGTTTPPSTTTPTTGFAITGVTTVSCETVSPTLRQISFTPQYAGLNGQAVTFSVIGEMMPTTSAGPYTIRVYTDNPTITLKAQQTGTNASFAYSWLAACANNTGTTTPTPPPVTNQVPRVTNPVADQQTTVNQPFTLAIPANTFSDPDNQSLAYSATGLPDGLRFDPGTATISGQPTSVGQSTVTLTATDPGNLSISITFVIRVDAAASTPGTTTPPSTTTPTTGFAITGVTTVNCETVSPTLRQISFTPQYAGLNGQVVTFSVDREMLPTTNAGPYSLRVYTDNPTITLRAKQSGSEATFAYNWLAACPTSNGRVSAEPVAPLVVTVLGNPVMTDVLPLEIRGAQGAWIRLQLFNERGYVTGDINIRHVDPVEWPSVKLDGPAGLYLLYVSTPTQLRIVKVLKL
jgi:glucose/arabinose dehydrogenase